jgi:type II secretory pathway pseudopilin PulG
MAALLVAMSIMAVMLTVAMPVWKHTAQREKEEELVFRGLQYVHAIGMFQRKFANAYPPNLDVLVDQRFLRKKYKDPVTNDEFVIIPVGQSLPGTAQNTGRGATGTGTSASSSTARGATSPPSSSQTGARGTSPIGTQGGGTGIQTTAGVSGVTSKSKDQSIRLYNGRSHYNEWAFVYTPQIQAAGQGAPGSAVPGRGTQGPGRGQPGTDPFGRGGQNDPFGRGQRPGGPGGFNPNNPGGGRGFGPGPSGAPVQPIFGPQPTGRGRL